MTRARITFNGPYRVCIDNVDSEGFWDVGEQLYLHPDLLTYDKILKAISLYSRGEYIGSVPVKWLTVN